MRQMSYKPKPAARRTARVGRGLRAAPMPKSRVEAHAGSGKTAGFEIHSLGIKAANRVVLAQEVKQGLDVDRLNVLRDNSGLSGEEIASVVSVSPRTISRRRHKGTLSATQSEHLVRVGLLIDQAQALFEGDHEAARRWLRQPNAGLGGIPPLQLADTELGAAEVSDLIARLEHGIPA